MKYSIDRIEENHAVLVNDSNEAIIVPVERFSFEPSEGMMVSVGKKCIRRLKQTEKIVKKNNNDLLRELLDRHV